MDPRLQQFVQAETEKAKMQVSCGNNEAVTSPHPPNWFDSIFQFSSRELTTLETNIETTFISTVQLLLSYAKQVQFFFLIL